MAFVITSECITERAVDCVEVCPVEAIYFEEEVPEVELASILKAKAYFGIQ